ncbi:MAG: dienelactone hydrolase family protein [Gammaproteobacteria bacterium]|nr:dienelactone hydrolase family protein [Gammaproteobacteria bacterium]MDP7154576.1 dienelactone hydrolase family protein [Gammaproteobacteria bacterium]MDP7297414.1 dienelactone hydrolase family protein [Gammaproteobacteria bacterium]MDP7419154.1 dienelactone hydrolase family protein [Gammaproteobacteria bacterium]MDP7659669.1 dienelactone hydrolase family protein [Gammaproteobacteria bacterium]
MGEMIQLTSEDEHLLTAYQATPKDTAKGGIVILQEIFGLTSHIRRVTDQYAEQGYLAIAPSLFDRVQADIILDYSDIDTGRSIMMGLDQNEVITDIKASVGAAQTAGNVAVIGYCWGGAMADLAACRVKIDAAVAYYGRMIVDWLDEQPGCPTIYHFGANDPYIPQDIIEKISNGRPDHPSYVYAEAGHGFNCDEREEFEPESAKLALDRTLEFLGRVL